MIIPSTGLLLYVRLSTISMSYRYLPAFNAPVCAAVKERITCPERGFGAVTVNVVDVLDAYDFLICEEKVNPVKFNGVMPLSEYRVIPVEKSAP
jgi:hypothetical protein